MNKNPANFVPLTPISFLHRTADIYVHLAWIEPCGNTQIEAMACGLPVVCCNNGGIGETIKNSSGGIEVIVISPLLVSTLNLTSCIDVSDGFIADLEKILLPSNLGALIDLDKRSNQPFEFNDYVIIYNGEVYNYLELSKEHKKSEHFTVKGGFFDGELLDLVD